MTTPPILFAVASSTEFVVSYRGVDPVQAANRQTHAAEQAHLHLTTPVANRSPYFTTHGAVAYKPQTQLDAAADDAFEALLAEAEADPITAQALQDGRRWVQQNYYNGECLAALRLSRGLSQAQLAERCGMNQSHIARYEAGGAMPQAANARRLAEQLGVTVDVIFSACERSRNKAD